MVTRSTPASASRAQATTTSPSVVRVEPPGVRTSRVRSSCRSSRLNALLALGWAIPTARAAAPSEPDWATWTSRSKAVRSGRTVMPR